MVDPGSVSFKRSSMIHNCHLHQWIQGQFQKKFNDSSRYCCQPPHLSHQHHYHHQHQHRQHHHHQCKHHHQHYDDEDGTWLLRASARLTEGRDVSFSILITTCQENLSIANWWINIELGMATMALMIVTVCCFLVSLVAAGIRALVSPSILCSQPLILESKYNYLTIIWNKKAKIIYSIFIWPCLNYTDTILDNRYNTDIRIKV